MSEGTLEAWVLDKDRFSDEDLGSVNIKLSDIQANKGMEDWFDLTLKDGTKKVFVCRRGVPRTGFAIFFKKTVALNPRTPTIRCHSIGFCT